MSAPTADEVLTLPDATAVGRAADAFRPAGARVVSAVEEAQTAWRPLGAPGVFDMPQTDEVLAAMIGPARIAAIVQTQCADVARALDAYASNLQTLAVVRAALIEAIGSQTAEEHQVQIGTADSTQQRLATEAAADSTLKQRVLAFNDAAQRADDDCAGALRQIQAYRARTLESLVQAAEEGNVGKTDLLEAAAEHIRKVPVLDIVGGAERPEGLPDGVDPQYTFDGTVLVPDPLDPKTLTPLASLPWWKRMLKSYTFVPEESALEDEVIPVAKIAGKALFWGGIGLTLAATFAERDQELQEDRPDMSLGDRLFEDGRTTLAVGAPTVAGSLIGAEVGPIVVGLAGAVGGGAAGAVGGIETGPGDLVTTAGGAAGGGGLGVVLGSVVGGLLGGMAFENVARSLDQGNEDAVDDGGGETPSYRRVPVGAQP